MNNSSNFKRFVPLLFVAGLVIAAFAAFSFMRAQQFHITKTDPSISGVSKAAPYMRLYFNKDIDPKSVKLDLTNAPSGGFVVNKRDIVVNFDSTMETGIKYSITVSAKSTGGESITNQALVFTAKDIPVSRLSKEQQDQLRTSQDQPQNTLYSIDFSSFNPLTSSALTSDQLNIVKQALFSFSQVRKEVFTSVQLVPNSLEYGPYDKNSANPVTTIIFSITANSNQYTVTVASKSMSDATVTIKDTANNLVYDSARANDF